MTTCLPRRRQTKATQARALAERVAAITVQAPNDYNRRFLDGVVFALVDLGLLLPTEAERLNTRVEQAGKGRAG